MRYFRATDGDRSRVLAAEASETYDLTSAEDGPGDLRDLLEQADETGRSLDAVAREHVTDAAEVDRSSVTLDVPVDAGEVWAAGVTYEISEKARETESEESDVYLDVYRSERPEIFFKATPSRTVGPGDAVGVRGDSTWDVPEPELAVVLHRGAVVGYTAGNDVSSRSIEGANPLYLPQAKVYDRCCALGPSVASVDSVDDPHDLELSMTIRRDGDTVYRESATTAEMVRTVEELTSYLTRHNALPETTVLLTGTALVPPDEFTLRPGDEVETRLEGVGVLQNGVVSV